MVKTYQFEFGLHLLHAHENIELIGIAPFVVRRGTSPRLEFVGQNKAYWEYVNFLVRTSLKKT